MIDLSGADIWGHKSAGDDLGHELVRVVDALAALISQSEGEGGGKVGGVGCREGFGRIGHGFRVTQRPEQDKNGFARPGGRGQSSGRFILHACPIKSFK